jgi:uncharacterized membrane protein YtjA (UPF0391 family)
MNGRAFLVRIGGRSVDAAGHPVDFGYEVRRFLMLSWALTFFIVAIIAAVLGFTTIAGAAAGIAKILFFIFLVLTLVALVAGALRGRPPV